MKNRGLGYLLLLSLMGALVSLPSPAHATNGAQFTSLSAEYVELDTNPNDGIYTDDRDGHADDLIVTFTESGMGNSKIIDITVSAVREISMTCLSATGSEVVVATEEPVSLRFPNESSEASATFLTDDDGHLTGIVPIHTSLAGYWASNEEGYEWRPGDVCPTQKNTTGVVYVLKDYSLTYTNLAVIDNENGGASASLDRVAPGYTSHDVTVAIGGGDFFGLSCTIHDDLGGNCHT